MIRATPADPITPPEGLSGGGVPGASANPPAVADSPATAPRGWRPGPRTRHWLAIALAAGMCVGDASADDRWQGTAWDGYGRVHEPSRHTRWRPGPIYQTLDAVAGGIEKLFRLDRRPGHQGLRRPGGDSGCDDACDDACDAATLLLIESGGRLSHPFGPADDRDLSEPPEVVEPNVRRMTPPPVVAPPVRPSPPGTRPLPPPPGPPAVPPRPQLQEPDGGSIFDALGDPFEDDSASRVPRGRRAIATGPGARSVR